MMTFLHINPNFNHPTAKNQLVLKLSTFKYLIF
jgi:hypothetical protein